MNITRGKILQELLDEGLVNLNPLQFLRIEKHYVKTGRLKPARRNGGNWRVYTPEEAKVVKAAMWEYYGGKSV